MCTYILTGFAHVLNACNTVYCHSRSNIENATDQANAVIAKVFSKSGEAPHPLAVRRRIFQFLGASRPHSVSPFFDFFAKPKFVFYVNTTRGNQGALVHTRTVFGRRFSPFKQMCAQAAGAAPLCSLLDLCLCFLTAAYGSLYSFKQFGCSTP